MRTGRGAALEDEDERRRQESDSGDQAGYDPQDARVEVCDGLKQELVLAVGRRRIGITRGMGAGLAHQI